MMLNDLLSSLDYQYMRYNTVKYIISKCLPNLAVLKGPERRERHIAMQPEAPWRSNCAIFSVELAHLVCARLRGLCRCKLPSGHHDIALLEMFSQAAWRPRTSWRDRWQCHSTSPKQDATILQSYWIASRYAFIRYMRRWSRIKYCGRLSGLGGQHWRKGFRLQVGQRGIDSTAVHIE